MKILRMKIVGDVKWLCSNSWHSVSVVKSLWRRRYSTCEVENQQQCILDSCSINPSHQEPRVIIVGAGIAGLSAASRLSQCGIRNFVVLEAKERLKLYINVLFHILIYKFMQ